MVNLIKDVIKRTYLVSHKVVPGNVAETAVGSGSDILDGGAGNSDGVQVCRRVERARVASLSNSNRSRCQDSGKSQTQPLKTHDYFVRVFRKTIQSSRKTRVGVFFLFFFF